MLWEWPGLLLSMTALRMRNVSDTGALGAVGLSPLTQKLKEPDVSGFAIEPP
jgi:hypothetical protein